MCELDKCVSVLVRSFWNRRSFPHSDVLYETTLVLLLEEVPEQLRLHEDCIRKRPDPDSFVVPGVLHVLQSLEDVNEDSDIGFSQLVLQLLH